MSNGKISCKQAAAILHCQVWSPEGIKNVSSICPQSPRASEDDCSRHADDFGTFQARNVCLSNPIPLKIGIPFWWSKNHMFICCCWKKSMFFLYIVSWCFMFAGFPWISRIPAADLCACGPGRPWHFFGTRPTVWDRRDRAPTESVETQWILASKWGFTNKIWVIFPRNMRTYEFHQQNMVKLPSKIGANWWWAVSCLNSLRWACRNHYRHNQLDKKDSGVINCLRLATKWGIQARKSSGFRVPTDMIWDKTMAMDYCQSTNNNHLYEYWT